MTERVPYDDGIAWRISVEMPLAARDSLREHLVAITEASVIHAPPQAMRREARRALAEAPDELTAWTREALIRMRAEYEVRLAGSAPWGVIYQYEAWRLDGPHQDDLHPVLEPL